MKTLKLTCDVSIEKTHEKLDVISQIFGTDFKKGLLESNIKTEDYSDNKRLFSNKNILNPIQPLDLMPYIYNHLEVNLKMNTSNVFKLELPLKEVVNDSAYTGMTIVYDNKNLMLDIKNCLDNKLNIKTKTTILEEN